jgi:phenylpropionate dioxygenase-like ring-hydroxylating dioxygenase large terminal subunit
MDARSRRIRNPNDLDAIVEAVLAGGGKTVETSETLPPEAYTSEAFFKLEERKIFREDWICVGHVSQVAKVGDYFTLDMFGEMLVVVRGPDRIRVLSRVCLHRWASIVSGSGNTRSFICPFHNWSYRLDGQLAGAPFMEKATDFNPKDCQLPEIRSEIVEDLGFIFIAFSDTIDSISERLKDLSKRLANYKINELVQVVPLFADAPYNWKFMIETGMEGYHHFGTHRTTLEPLYPTKLTWCEESKKGWTICHSPAVKDRDDITLPVFPGLDDDEMPGLDLYHIYPLTRLGIYPDRIRIQTVIPVSASRTARRTIYLVRPEVAAQPGMVEEGFQALLKPAVGSEDLQINLMQQAAAQSQFTSIGRLSHLEATVWHLAEYLRAKLREH